MPQNQATFCVLRTRMIMSRFVTISLLTILSLMFSFSLAISGDENGDNYVQDACSVTQYHDLCIHSLAPFANTCKDNPSQWARAGVSVTIGEAKNVTQYLANMNRSRRGNGLKGRDKIALLDCIDNFQDTLDNLHKSLDVLRKLSVGEFSSEMEDVMTWVSAALTDEETCVDGFDGVKGKRVRLMLNRVSNVSNMTSNALALVNKLATTGPRCITNE